MSYKLLFITHNSNSVSHNFFKVRLQFAIPFKIPKCQTADFERNCELEADFKEIVRD